tara:strand:+ start:3835 stop:5541 length:1707 start_codon:yes stop_codon:yes gene_type:complete
MKKTTFILTLIFTFCFIDLIAQVKSNLWYDGNARVTYNRDALEGILKEKDTTSSRSNGGGFTVLDLGLHFTPIDDIEISSEIRLKNDFGGMWGNKSVVELRSLSAKGVVNNKIAFSVGDIYLKQTKYTLYNYEQELSMFEPSIFEFYRDFVNYENYYKSNYWRLHGLQTNFSYNMYNHIKQLDFDAFATRIRGQEWMGKPELLMIGGSAVIKSINNLNLGTHYVNTFEVLSSSNGDVFYYNPVLNTQLSYTGKLRNMPYKFLLEGGFSTRGWDGDTLAPEVKGNFAEATISTKTNKGKIKIGFRYVDTDFRSAGAQTRRVNYNTTTTTYPYYTNNYTQRNASLIDIISDPKIYNQNLSTSIMNYNPMYSSTEPYGNATPNRVGFTVGIDNFNITNYISAKFQTQYFSEAIGQGTINKRFFSKSSLHSLVSLDKLLSFKNSFDIEGSVNFETVQRNGDDFEVVDLKTILCSGAISYEILKNFKLIAGVKMFLAEGNEFITERDIYDQIIAFENTIYNSKETILIAGLQHYFTDNIYFTMQYNKFNVLDKTKVYDEFSIGRIIFMFNMNL